MTLSSFRPPLHDTTHFMMLLRYFTWYYRYANRWCRYAVSRFPSPGAAGQFAYLVFLGAIPGLVGCAIYALFYALGLTQLVSDGYFPSFIQPGTETVFVHGATSFAAVAIVFANVYFILGALCATVDAFRPPKYKKRKHLWKDWTSD